VPAHRTRISPGGPAGFGLRRCLIDQNSVAKGELARGEHKSIQTDRVILVPGPPEEIEIVRWIYRAFVEDRKTEHDIGDILNRAGFLPTLGALGPGTVHQILINEKYIGNNIWNRTSFKLKKKHIRNGPETWLRSDGTFEVIAERSASHKHLQSIPILPEKKRLIGDVDRYFASLMLEGAAQEGAAV
jgi:hypothetical protein